MVLVDAIILYFSLRLLCYVGQVTIFFCDKITLATQKVKVEIVEPLEKQKISPCGEYEEIRFENGLIWAAVGNDL